MCIDSAAKPEDMHSEIGLWPCHAQGGNQVLMILSQRNATQLTNFQSLFRLVNKQRYIPMLFIQTL